MTDPEMPTANDAPAPAADTAIQDKGPAAVTTEPAAKAPGEQPPPPARDRLAARVRLLDGLLVGLVLVLAFLLGSFAIQNSDFWMHLATGRLLSSGAYTFGTDPFSHATAGLPWVNHSWLFDWLLYNLYQLVGAAGLIVLRGLLVALLAEVMLRFRRPGQSLWAPAVCAALAVLTLSPRLLMQPALVSLLLLTLTLYLLHRGAEQGARFTLPGGRSLSVLWLLPPLFALWANLDGWFVLGPLTVGLYLLGAAIQQATAPPDAAGGVRTLALVLVAGLAACLLNPHLHRVFVLPLDLAYLLADVLPEGLVPSGVAARSAAAQYGPTYADYSPFADIYWGTPNFGRNAAGLAYFPLLLLSGLSFVPLALLPAGTTAGARRFPLGLFLVWLVFAALGAIHFRLIGFFAAVAGPVAILNLQQQGRPVDAAELARRRGWAVGGRLLTALGCLVLLLLAWPGWLHGFADDPRRSHRVAWDAPVHPLIEQAAKRLDELLATGKLRHGFNVTPDLANYFAWFAGPRARTFFDTRFALPPRAAADYARTRKLLRLESRRALAAEFAALTKRPGPPPGDADLRELRRVFAEYGIDYLVVSSLAQRDDTRQVATPWADPALLLLTALSQLDEARDVTNRLVLEPRQWAPLYDDGHTAIFGWRDPARPDNPFAGLEVDRDRAAFGKIPNGLRAPLQAPAAPDGPPNAWHVYAFGSPPPAAADAAARASVSDYRLLSPQLPRWQRPFLAAVEATLSAGPSGPAPGPPPEFGAPGLAALWSDAKARQGLGRAVLVNDAGPPALPVLGVRAGRRAVGENPADAGAYAALAEAYLTLWRLQEQRWAPGTDPRGSYRDILSPQSLLSRQTLRHIQTVTAVNQSLRLRPDNPRLHHLLAMLYAQMNFLDAALEHARLAQEQLAAAGSPEAGQSPLGREVEGLVKGLSAEVNRRREEYDLQAAGRRTPLAKFQAALLEPTGQANNAGKGPPPERGLVKLALKVLGEADMTLPAKADARVLTEHRAIVEWQIRLMLLLGMSRELRESAFPAAGQTKEGDNAGKNFRALLGEAYDFYEALLAAAEGRYGDADRILSAWERGQRVPELQKALAKMRKQLDAERVMQTASLAASVPLVPVLVPLAPPQLSYSLNRSLGLSQRWLFGAQHLRNLTELRALQGLLALERGDTDRAAEDFRVCLEREQGRLDFPSRGIAARYLARLKKFR